MPSCFSFKQYTQFGAFLSRSATGQLARIFRLVISLSRGIAWVRHFLLCPQGQKRVGGVEIHTDSICHSVPLILTIYGCQHVLHGRPTLLSKQEVNVSVERLSDRCRTHLVFLAHMKHTQLTYLHLHVEQKLLPFLATGLPGLAEMSQANVL